MIPDFTGQTVGKVNHAYAIYLWTLEGWEFRLPGKCFFSQPGQTPTQIPTDVELDVVPQEVQDLMGKRIESLLVSAEGHLAIDFEHGQLSVMAEPEYESWELSGPGGAKIICGPGGELTIWGERP